MPWKANDAKKHKAGMTPEMNAKWARIANGILKECEESGGDDCEAKAIRIANSKCEAHMKKSKSKTEEESY